MRKIFMLLLVCVTISLLNTGCVDVAGGPGGGGQVNPDTPTNPNDPNNPGDPTNPDNPTNPSDPDIGEPGVNYITNWTTYDTTTSPQKYIGATYDASNIATVEKTVGRDGPETAPYKTNFSDGSVSYSIGEYDYVYYSENSSATDCYYVGTAPEGFTSADFTYDSSTNEVNINGEATSVESTGSTEGRYTVFRNTYSYSAYYITSQPILKVEYYKSASSESYRAKEDIYNMPYVTIWKDGKKTYSLYPFGDDAGYRSEKTKDFSVNDAELYWYVGEAPDGRKESDYVYTEELGRYKYTAGGAATPTPTPTEPEDNSDDEGLSSDDVADIINDIIDNDGRDLLAP
jgi:hypothetical protein